MTQQAAFEVVAPGGRVALVLPPVVEVPEGKHVAGVHAGLKKPHNHPLLYDLYHDKAYNLVASGVVKVSLVPAQCSALLIIVSSLTDSKSSLMAWLVFLTGWQD